MSLKSALGYSEDITSKGVKLKHGKQQIVGEKKEAMAKNMKSARMKHILSFSKNSDEDREELNRQRNGVHATPKK